MARDRRGAHGTASISRDQVQSSRIRRLEVPPAYARGPFCEVLVVDRDDPASIRSPCRKWAWSDGKPGPIEKAFAVAVVQESGLRSTYRLASWNIGADPAEASSSGDIFGSHPARVASHLDSLNLDFLCLQEQHFIGDRSEGAAIAGLLGLANDVELPLDISHRRSAGGAHIGISVLSKHRLSAQAHYLLPNPGLVSMQPSGDSWSTDDKGLILVQADLGRRKELTIVCLHLLPLHRFGVAQDSSIAAALWSDLDSYLCGRIKGHAIIAGDFNSDAVIDYLPLLVGREELTDLGFPRPRQSQAYDDHIMVSRDLRVISHSVLQATAEFDHGPCVVEFAF